MNKIITLSCISLIIRFFCPPPSVYLAGDGWSTEADSSDHVSVAEMLKQKVCAYLSITGNEQSAQELHFDDKGHAAAKTLFISDSDKRKQFTLTLNLYTPDGSIIGTFQSRRLKVISKPSKKKQSLKNAELCIQSGTRVALFNRLRSQTVSTRYLHVEDGEFCASSSQWTAFTMHLISDDEKESDEFTPRGGYIHYGSTVKLVDSVTGMALPRVVIRKVDKQMVMVDADDPVSQLHKCALHFKDSDRMYLCLSQDRLLQYQSQSIKGHSRSETVSDGAAWTIISTERLQFSFYDAKPIISVINGHPIPLSSHQAVSPVPTISSLHLNGSGEVAMLEIMGENFSPFLKVWFGDVSAQTFYRSAENLLCKIPDISSFQPTWTFVIEQFEVLLSLVRDDGIIYGTGVTFTYTPEPCVRPPVETTRSMPSQQYITSGGDISHTTAFHVPYNSQPQYTTSHHSLQQY